MKTKLTHAQKTEIINRYHAKEKTAAIAESYGIRACEVSKIANGAGLRRHKKTKRRGQKKPNIEIAMGNSWGATDSLDILSAVLKQQGLTDKQRVAMLKAYVDLR